MNWISRILEIKEYLLAVIAVATFLYWLYKSLWGISKVLYRLGIGIAKRKIAIFSKDNFDSLRDMLIDTGVVLSSNIVRIDSDSIKKAEDLSIFLVDWKSFSHEIGRVIDIKKDATSLIIYAPPDSMTKEQFNLFNQERNTIIVNARGRLVNDVLVSMMTTQFKP